MYLSPISSLTFSFGPEDVQLESECETRTYLCQPSHEQSAKEKSVHDAGPWEDGEMEKRGTQSSPVSCTGNHVSTSWPSDSQAALSVCGTVPVPCVFHWTSRSSLGLHGMRQERPAPSYRDSAGSSGGFSLRTGARLPGHGWH